MKAKSAKPSTQARASFAAPNMPVRSHSEARAAVEPARAVRHLGIENAEPIFHWMRDDRIFCLTVCKQTPPSEAAHCDYRRVSSVWVAMRAGLG